MPDAFHVSSLVVHCRRERAAAIAAVLRDMDGMEVHGGVPEGKLVVTLETATEGDIVERLNQVQLLDGVLAATLVFHQFEPSHPRDSSTGSSSYGSLTP
ncbi:chaperone NapD [Teichococcus oryzae]|uniref:Chaperone NapD n=1 Tax=Teichococcus oryzae TaxID=1608942 RepID=A0A5B2TFP1_9PROT|nr:chaperone NapD [Pseudoroseomonas oryzae]KAA2212989.1 glutamate synthase [Pseudoroseomonas oryzae]